MDLQNLSLEKRFSKIIEIGLCRLKVGNKNFERRIFVKQGKHWIRFFFIAILSVAMVLLLVGYQAYRSLPEKFTVNRGEHLTLSQPGFSVQRMGIEDTAKANLSTGKETYQAQIALWGIPIKTVTVSETNPIWVIPGGTPFGIKLFTNGVMVVGTSDIATETGNSNPAADAGILLGDIIIEINGTAVTASEMISKMLEESNGAPVTMTVDRNGELFTVTVIPAKASYDGQYKGGLWVRDSTAGIGIVTYYCPESGTFGGLGHGICDVDTNGLMPLRTGEIVPVCISGVVKGQEGDAGELKGYFTSEESIGQLYRNDDTGVYGVLNGAPRDAEPVAVAMKQTVKKGTAQILTTIDGESPRYYDIEIESIDLREETLTKNMVIRITDPDLLEQTGGIVQGMSGSPILQDGKLIGAVTHVLVNDPTRGYGIFIENMLDAAG